jgi:hypothetical protein
VKAAPADEPLLRQNAGLIETLARQPSPMRRVTVAGDALTAGQMPKA